MKIFYYYHISKTGGTSIVDFFKYIVENVPNCILYDYSDWDKLTPNQKDINFDVILNDDNIKKYDYIFIHHHHGYHGLMHYKNLLIKRKKELKSNGHDLKIFTTIRDVLSFNNSRINYLIKKGLRRANINNFLTNEIHYNVQTKYLFFCWHGEWPSSRGLGPINIDIVNNEISEKNIDTLSEIIDLFIEISNLTNFLKIFTEYFNVTYNYNIKSNTTSHIINFNSDITKLVNNNKLDCYLLKKYSNNNNFDNEVYKFLQ